MSLVIYILCILFFVFIIYILYILNFNLCNNEENEYDNIYYKKEMFEKINMKLPPPLPNVNIFLNNLVFSIGQTLNNNSTPVPICNNNFGILSSPCVVGTLSPIGNYSIFVNGIFKDSNDQGKYILSGDNTSGYFIYTQKVNGTSFQTCPPNIVDNSNTYNIISSGSASNISCNVQPITLNGTPSTCNDPNFPVLNNGFCYCSNLNDSNCFVSNFPNCPIGQTLCSDGLCYGNCPSGYNRALGICNKCIASIGNNGEGNISIMNDKIICGDKSYTNINGVCWTYKGASGNTQVYENKGLLYDSNYVIPPAGYSNIFYLNNLEKNYYIKSGPIIINLGPINMSLQNNNLQITFSSINIIFQEMFLKLQPSWSNLQFDLNLIGFDIVLNIPAIIQPNQNTPPNTPSVLFAVFSDNTALFLNTGYSQNVVDFRFLQYIILNLINKTIDIINKSSNNDIPFICDIINKYASFVTYSNQFYKNADVDPFSNYVYTLLNKQLTSSITNVMEDIPIFGWMPDGPLCKIINNIQKTTLDKQIEDIDTFSRFFEVLQNFDTISSLYDEMNIQLTNQDNILTNNLYILELISDFNASFSTTHPRLDVVENILNIFFPSLLNTIYINSNIANNIGNLTQNNPPPNWTQPPIVTQGPIEDLLLIATTLSGYPLIYTKTPSSPQWSNTPNIINGFICFSNNKFITFGTKTLNYYSDFLSSNSVQIQIPNSTDWLDKVSFDDISNVIAIVFANSNPASSTFYYSYGSITSPNWIQVTLPNMPPLVPNSDLGMINQIKVSSRKIFIQHSLGNLYCYDINLASWSNVSIPQLPITPSSDSQSSGSVFSTAFEFNGYDNLLLYAFNYDFNSTNQQLWYANINIYSSPVWISINLPPDINIVSVKYCGGNLCVTTTESLLYSDNYTYGNWVINPTNTTLFDIGFSCNPQKNIDSSISTTKKPISSRGPLSTVTDILFTGEPINFTIPAGFDTLSFYMWGGGGGGPIGSGNNGGNGAFISGSFNINSPEIVTYLNIIVSVGEGGKVGDGSSSNNEIIYGGGGRGGGGSGGGASIISITDSFFNTSSILAVAGGGGGAGNNYIGAGNGGWAASTLDNISANGSPGNSGGGGVGLNTQINGALGGLPDGQSGTSGFGIQTIDSNGFLGQGGIGSFNFGGGGGGGYIGGGGGGYQGGGGGGCSFTNTQVNPYLQSQNGITPVDLLPFTLPNGIIPGLGGTSTGIGGDGFIRIILSNSGTSTLPPVNI
jgi:hypothetical protein